MELDAINLLEIGFWIIILDLSELMVNGYDLILICTLEEYEILLLNFEERNRLERVDLSIIALHVCDDPFL